MDENEMVWGVRENSLYEVTFGPYDDAEIAGSYSSQWVARLVVQALNDVGATPPTNGSWRDEKGAMSYALRAKEREIVKLKQQLKAVELSNAKLKKENKSLQRKVTTKPDTLGVQVAKQLMVSGLVSPSDVSDSTVLDQVKDLIVTYRIDLNRRETLSEILGMLRVESWGTLLREAKIQTEWRRHAYATLDIIHRTVGLGEMTSYSDEERNHLVEVVKATALLAEQVKEVEPEDRQPSDEPKVTGRWSYDGKDIWAPDGYHFYGKTISAFTLISVLNNIERRLS